MAQNRTTRDQLERLFDIGRRAVRYWWIVAVVGAVGAGLSVAIALKQKHVYESETTLLYSEKISQSVLQGREVVQSSRKLTERYKEMLLARSNLALIVEEFALLPGIVEDRGTIAAAEVLRSRISFRDKGDIFRISYQGASREEAQKVTARLATLLKEQDNAVRREQAEQTKTFLEEEKRRAELGLRARETELAGFLAQHPEFVEDGAAGGEGASIRAAQTKKAAAPKGNTELSTLQRQRSRIQARLDNPDGPVIPIKSSVTPAKESAALKESRRTLQTRERELAEKLARFTEKHPDVVSAKNAVSDAKQRLRRVEAEETATLEPGPAPIRSPVDRAALQSELTRIDREIARVRARSANPAAKKKGESSLADELVSLETEYTRMARRVDEGRERLETLGAKVFTAEITASSEFAEAAQLVVIDEAFLPTQPAGQGRKLIAIAGTLVFGVLGLAFAITLALIDDRIYRRQDIDDLGIAPVLVVIPKHKGKKARG